MRILARLAIVVAALVAAVPVSAQTMNADAARRFVVGKLFAWAVLGLDAVAVVAAAAGLRVAEAWFIEDEQRWQAELVHAGSWLAPGRAA